MDKLPVLFRASRDKAREITAIFPTLPWDTEGRTITCYAHVGQHGGCNHQFIYRTRAAKPEEYVDLLAELRDIYGRKHHDEDTEYDLIVYARTQSAHRKAFDAEVRRNRNYLERGA